MVFTAISSRSKQALWAASILWLLSGCFAVREPAAPNTSGEWNPPSEPQILIENLRKAFNGLNLINYERCFAKTGFSFVAEPTVAGNSIGVFARWTLVEELEYVKNLRNRSNLSIANDLTLSNVRTNFLTGDSIEYNATYSIRLNHLDSTFGKYNFAGNLIFTMRRNDNNEWIIRRWQDNQTSGPCWSEIKQRFIVP